MIKLKWKRRHFYVNIFVNLMFNTSERSSTLELILIQINVVAKEEIFRELVVHRNMFLFCYAL